ncbi:hypothetical protein LZZ90_00955 [Flavobacterium sp. SM15]|uniref:hypothetical protein n=1 Tax=Flavobacterium sp. SM15 TaxID=2908005 RepID=UPI001ED9D67E|nr:hypothetical protein [Flavobacterium sp. SM15]MCG2610069.1 hypothetical protein [Flavobacterium sp. SM15]
MKRNVFKLDSFSGSELDAKQLKTIQGGWGPTGPTTPPPAVDPEGEPVGTGGNGDGKDGDVAPPIKGTPTIP